MAVKYQNLDAFYSKPFGNAPDARDHERLKKMYDAYIKSNKIRLVAICNIKSSYYYHIKVPSETQKKAGLFSNYEYDVVVRFFPNDEVTNRGNSLRPYYVQFFSNSPSFMYTYAYVYKRAGYLIEALYDKLDPDYIDTPPTKTNPNLKKSYDKSIYFACRFLVEREFYLLVKSGIQTWIKRTSPDKFFRDISDFKSVKLDQALMNEEKKLQKNLNPDARRQSNRNVFKIKKQMSTRSRNNDAESIRIVAKKNGSSHIVGKRQKIKPVRSTKRRK